MREPFPKGVDPRTYLRNHHERGRQEYVYTYEDLARILGVEIQTAMNMASRRLFRPDDLDSFVALCVSRALKKNKL